MILNSGETKSKGYWDTVDLTIEGIRDRAKDAYPSPEEADERANAVSECVP